MQHYPFFVSGGLPTSGTPRGSFPIPRVFPGGLPYPLPPCLSRGESPDRGQPLHCSRGQARPFHMHARGRPPICIRAWASPMHGGPETLDLRSYILLDRVRQTIRALMMRRPEPFWLRLLHVASGSELSRCYICRWTTASGPCLRFRQHVRQPPRQQFSQRPLPLCFPSSKDRPCSAALVMALKLATTA